MLCKIVNQMSAKILKSVRDKSQIKTRLVIRKRNTTGSRRLTPLANYRNEKNLMNWQTEAWNSYRSRTGTNWESIKKQHWARYNQIVRYPLIQRRKVPKLSKKFTTILLSGTQKKHLSFSKLTKHLDKNTMIHIRKKNARDCQVLWKIFSLTNFQKNTRLKNLARNPK